MSITYEEALETLESMFGEPWTRESLDAVLRHFQGHMENTVESVLGHGSGNPQALIDKLKSGKNNNDTTQLDQELARQLQREQQGQAAVPASGSGPASSTTKKQTGRGTPTELPSDFLRIPGYKGSSSSTAATSAAGAAAGGTMDQDEALARMLQDELFSQELANNPEFAHLARPRTVGGRPVGQQQQQQRVAQRASSASRPAAAGGPSLFAEEGAKVIEKIGDLGNEAKKRLNFLAAQWNSTASKRFGTGAVSTPTNVAETASNNETRGLLDGGGGSQDGDDEMEMSFAGKKYA